MYGSLTTKEIKKKHSPRPAGGAETGSWAERTWARWRLVDPVRWQLWNRAGQAAAGRSWTLRPHILAWINQEELWGSKADRTNQLREIKPQTSD